MGGHQFVSDSTTEYSTRYVYSEPTVPATATFIKECGCYETSHSDYRDRVWVTYTHHTTTYHLCIKHMQEHQQHMKVRRENEEKERIEDEEREKIWADRCIRAKPAVKKEQQLLIQIMTKLKLPRLRELKNVVSLYSWSCSLHRGYVILRFAAAHSQFCPVKDELIDFRIQKSRRCACSANLPIYKFKYIRRQGKYTFENCD